MINMMTDSFTFTQAVLDTLKAHIAVLDQAGNIVAVNEAWRRFGRENELKTANDGLGVNYLALCDQVKDETNKDASLVAAALRDILSGHTETAEVEYPCHSPQEQRWFCVHISRVQNQDQLYLFVAHENVTHHKLSESRFRLLIERSTDAISLVAVDGTILYQSPAITHILGYQPEEMVGQNAFVFLHPDDVAASVNSLTQGLQQPDLSTTSQFRYLHKDGHYVWLEGIGTNRLAMVGIEAIVVNLRDITERILAEEAVRTQHQLREQVAKIAETAPGALFSFRQRPDETNALPYVSQAWELLMGLTQADVRDDATPVVQRIHADDEAYVVHSIQVSAQNMTPWRVEFRFIHADRGIIWLEGHSTPLVEPDGSILWHGFITDISERKKAEESLHTQAYVLENISQGVNYVDEHKIIRYTNRAFEQIFGYEPGELIGQPATILNDLPPEENARFIESVMVMVEAQGHWRGEIRNRKKDGTPILTSAHVTGIPMQGQLFAVTVQEDITERQQAEQALRDKEQWLRLALEAGELGTWQHDQRTGMIHLDDRGRDMYGFSHHDVPDTLIRVGIHPDDMLLLRQAFLESARPEGDGHYRAEYRFTRPDGAVRWLALQAQAFFAGEGADRQPVWGVGTVQDITIRKQIEEDARVAQEFFRILFHVSPVPTVLLRWPELTIADLNQSFANMVDYPRDELLHQDFLHLRLSQDPVVIEEAVRKLVETNHLQDYEYTFINRHKETRESLIFAERVIQQGNEFVIVKIIDITERKQAEKTIQAERQHFRDLFEHSPMPTWLEDLSGIIQWMDELRTQGVTDLNEYLAQNPEQMAAALSLIKVVDVNQAAVSQNAARDKAHLINSLAQLLIPETYPGVQKEIEALWQNGRSVEFTLNGQRLDGQPLTAIIRMDVPEPNGEPDYARVIITSTDITELTQAEKALRESEERLGGIVGSAMDAIITVDEEQNVVLFNAAAEKMFACNTQDALGQSINRFVPARFHEAHGEDIRLFSRTNTTNRAMGRLGELMAVRADGIEFPIEASISQTAAAGKPLFTIILRDITERKQMVNALAEERNLLASRVAERTANLSQANAELARANRLKDEFLSNMSHELRTPLNAILNLSESLQERVYGDINHQQNETLRIIGESGQHLLELINDILDLSKIEAGKLQLLLTTTNIETVCQATIRMTREPAIKKNLRMALEMEPDMPDLIADERRLKQILVNLFSNAVKFTPDGGQIGLKVVHDAAAEAVRFTVWDTGIGIASEQLPALFKPFVQLDSALSRQYSGSGLGLALVHRLVELHGGSVGVESEPGQGSRFFFTLPITPFDAIMAQTADPLPQLAFSTSPTQPVADAPLILIVDDNPVNVLSLSDYLVFRGFRTQIAINGTEAIQMAHEFQPNLIIMDVQMPEVDGLEITRHLRRLPAFATTPIIALTALAMPSDREKCLQAGMSHYVTKPVSLKGFTQLITSILYPQT